MCVHVHTDPEEMRKARDSTDVACTVCLSRAVGFVVDCIFRTGHDLQDFI